MYLSPKMKLNARRTLLGHRTLPGSEGLRCNTPIASAADTVELLVQPLRPWRVTSAA